MRIRQDERCPQCYHPVENHIHVRALALGQSVVGRNGFVRNDTVFCETQNDNTPTVVLCGCSFIVLVFQGRDT